MQREVAAVLPDQNDTGWLVTGKPSKLGRLSPISTQEYVLGGDHSWPTDVRMADYRTKPREVAVMTQVMIDTKVLQEAVELACRAPSLHNSQPWRWVVSGTTVDLFADPHRMVASTDNSGREAIISCGVVLDHFRDAVVAMGWDTNVDQFPNPSDRDHLASMGFAPAGGVTAAQRDRAAAISRRRTDRRRSAHQENGSRSSRCCGAHSKTIWRSLTYWLTKCGPGWCRRLA